MKPLIEQKIDSIKDSIIIEYMSENNFNEVTVRTTDYKYYVNTKGQEILYDMKKDPFELNNIAYVEEYKEIKSLMRFEMIKKMQLSSYNSREKMAPY